jgi:hypothetical protein
MSIPHADLVETIEAFCAAHGIAETRFGKDALGDPSFVAELRAGRECRRGTLSRVKQFMARVKDRSAA